jgi:hypothetical protein
MVVQDQAPFLYLKLNVLLFGLNPLTDAVYRMWRSLKKQDDDGSAGQRNNFMTPIPQPY